MSNADTRIAQLIGQGASQLRAAGIETPERDARLLFAFNWSVPSEVVYPPYTHPKLHERFVHEFGAINGFFDLVAGRARGRPVSKIIGARDFWKHRFRVTDDVLDPRPETETLVELALQAPFVRVLDLGTGSGCILLSLLAERTDARGIGVDISDAALVVAADNARQMDLVGRADFLRSDWFSDVTGNFDLIVSNPPYIAATEMAGLAPDVRLHDPQIALTPGGDGLDAYRKITKGVARHLGPNGRLVVEIGPTQGQAVCELMAQAGLERITVTADLDGRDRVVSGRKA